MEVLIKEVLLYSCACARNWCWGKEKITIVGRGTSYSYQEFIIRRRECRRAVENVCGKSHDLN